MKTSAEVAFAALLVEDRHHLFLGGDVQGGGGLVRDEQSGLREHRRSDHDALQEAA